MRDGLYFEDFLPGEIYTTEKRTITETDLVNFVTQTGMFEALFMDVGYVKSETHYGRRIAPGLLTLAFAEGLVLHSGILRGRGIAFLGMEMKIKRPVFIGDTIYVEVNVIDKKETSKADRGIMTFCHRTKNQNGDVVMECKMKRMIKKRVGEKT